LVLTSFGSTEYCEDCELEELEDTKEPDPTTTLDMEDSSTDVIPMTGLTDDLPKELTQIKFPAIKTPTTKKMDQKVLKIKLKGIKNFFDKNTKF
jgi:hypothetical protein